MNSEIANPLKNVDRKSLVGPGDDEEDSKDVSLGPNFDLGAFSGSDLAPIGTF